MLKEEATSMINEKYINSLCADLRNEDAEQYNFISDEALRQIVCLGIDTAQKLKYSQKSSIAGFVSLFIDVGPGFFEHSEIKKIFLDATTHFVDEDKRLEWVVGTIPKKVWEDALKDGWSV